MRDLGRLVATAEAIYKILPTRSYQKIPTKLKGVFILDMGARMRACVVEWDKESEQFHLLSTRGTLIADWCGFLFKKSYDPEGFEALRELFRRRLVRQKVEKDSIKFLAVKRVTERDVQEEVSREMAS